MDRNVSHFLLAVSLLFIWTCRHLVTSIEIGNACALGDRTIGICQPFASCQPAIEELQEQRKNHMLGAKRIHTRCGFDGIFEIVCCKLPEESKPPDPEEGSHPENDKEIPMESVISTSSPDTLMNHDISTQIKDTMNKLSVVSTTELNSVASFDYPDKNTTQDNSMWTNSNSYPYSNDNHTMFNIPKNQSQEISNGTNNKSEQTKPLSTANGLENKFQHNPYIPLPGNSANEYNRIPEKIPNRPFEQGFNEFPTNPSHKNENHTDKIHNKPINFFDSHSNGAHVPAKRRKVDRACAQFEDEIPAPLGFKIMDGEDALQAEFPHMAALGYDKDEGMVFDCGGTIISDRYVLTAAKCISNTEDIPPSIVRVGTLSLLNNFDTTDTDFEVEETFIYPEFITTKKYHDIALIRLKRSIPFSDTAHPACLYTKDDDPKGTLIVTGWGRTTNDDTESRRSKTLQKASLSAVSQSECTRFYEDRLYKKRLPNGITPYQICAVDPSGHMDTCDGDAGGPLQISIDTVALYLYYVVGVTSFGKECGEGIPTVYVRVSKYLDWIEGIVWP